MGAVSNIVLNLVMTPFMGALGAAIATAVCYFVVWVIRYWNSKKFIKLKINLKRDLITYVLLAAQSIVLLLEDGIVLYGVEIGMFLVIVILYAGDLMSIAKKGKQYDCKAWANWAVERFGEEKSVFFMGVSTGASVAMMSSNLGLPKSVRGIIDDCGFTSTMEMIDVNCKSHLPDYIPTRMFDFFVEMGTSVWGHFCISKADACKAVSQTDIPILIIHGDRDTKAPLSMAYRLYDSCSSEKQLYVVHGANHAESYRKDPEGYENVIAQFVEEHSEALKKEY